MTPLLNDENEINDNEILLDTLSKVDNEETITNGEELEVVDNEKDENNEKTEQPVVYIFKTPVWVWMVLVFALFTMSSAGSVLMMINVPPLLKASWRLQSTSLFLFFGLFYDLNSFYQYITVMKIKKLYYSVMGPYQKQLDEKEQEKMVENEKKKLQEISEIWNKLFQRNTIALIVATGLILGLHFAFWVTSLNETTLPHSLLFVTSSPLMVIVVMLVLRKPITKMEIIGALVGFLGLLITLLGSFISTTGSGSQRPTVYGDLLALLGAACIVFYLFVGQKLRQWLPLFMYAFPVTFIGSILLTVLSLIFETAPEAIRSYSIVGWFQRDYILKVLYLGIFPGLFGHTGVNGIIKYIEPVIISVTLLLEPPIGSLIGYILGVSDGIDIFTLIGGPIIIGGCILVTISNSKKK
ncbi:hypothetical protein DLAC_02584 [Tieghemostelium lacteum]|uniref:EamA domain-containing protein n=1 Tax=Tieghemostelium lacteum TaxID=361077 RepID=A0A152A387_TIELA|nr:hypothetical protein DLAC_02584 [Tieghemostelium lacteum]|eukprot:KYR00567.1 hypothetical protein DLAC_02584 [Tieghemostelium lacteum]